jgi:hypothetical protein
MQMKQWRGIASRYCKNVASFVAGVQICCLMMWARLVRRWALVRDADLKSVLFIQLKLNVNYFLAIVKGNRQGK